MTFQIKDILHYKGQQYRLEEELVEPYFLKYPKRKPQSNLISSALHRGYIATVELQDKILWIRDFQITLSENGKEKKVSKFAEVFPNQPEDCKLNWVDVMVLLAHKSKRAYWRFFGFRNDDPQEAFELLRFSAGKLTATEHYSFEGWNDFMEAQLLSFKASSKYGQLLDTWQRGFARRNKNSTKKFDRIKFQRRIEANILWHTIGLDAMAKYKQQQTT
ncbi:MAG: hypothetical protein ACPGJS_16360 [Flammeovirgaceae bacterium]